jgi:tetratricopeptide (TPR) repeat protein
MKNKDIFLPIVFSAVAIFFIVGFFMWTALPYWQMSVWRKGADAFMAGDDSAFPSDPAIYNSPTSVQGRMRIDAFSWLFNQYVHGTRKEYTPLYDQALGRLKEWIEAHPYRYDELLFLAKAYEYKANFTGDTSLYAVADDYYKKAIALSPERQDLLYAYAEHLSNTGRKDEAVALLSGMVQKYPDILQNEYYLGVVLAANDKKDYNSALAHLERVFNKGVQSYDAIIIKALYEHFFVYYYEQNDFERFSLVVHRLIHIDPSQKDSYTTIADYVDAHHSIPLINIHE